MVNLFLNVAAPLLMFTIGLNTSPGNFQPLFAGCGSPDFTAFLASIASTLFLIPLLAVAVCLTVQPPEAGILGIVIMSLLPGGPYANICAIVSRANKELNASLTTIEQLMSGLLLPFGLLVIVPATFDAQEISRVPYSELVHSILLVIFPLLFGILGSFAWGVEKPVRAVRIGILLAIIFMGIATRFSTVEGTNEPLSHMVRNALLAATPPSSTVLAAILFGVGTVIWGAALGWLILPSQPIQNRNSILLEVAVRDLSVFVPITVLGLAATGYEFQMRVITAGAIVFFATNILSTVVALSIAWCCRGRYQEEWKVSDADTHSGDFGGLF